MSAFADSIINQVLALQVRLYACQARLCADTDDEALHDLRIALRKLRSLLKPLRALPSVEPLEQAAAVLGRLTGPLRDREVLLAELQRRGQGAYVATQAQPLQRQRAAVAGAREFTELLQLLDAWPQRWRQAGREGHLKGAENRVRRGMRRQQRKLARALRDPQHDRHRLRLLIKRVRYGAQTYPQASELAAPVRQRLKRAQGDLGAWHDRLQWLARVETEQPLAACRDAWQQELALAEQRADETLMTLFGDFPLPQ